MDRVGFGSEESARSPRVGRLAGSIAALSALLLAADVLGVGGPQPAAAAPPSSASAAPANPLAADVGFDELPNLLAIEPLDGAVDASLDGVIRLTFDAPIAPESLSYLSVNLEERGIQNVIGRLSVEGDVVTFTPMRPLLLDHDYGVQVAALVQGSGWLELSDTSFHTRDGIWSKPAALVEGGANSPELAMDGDGNALLLWEASTDQGARLRGAYLAASAGAWQSFAPTASGGSAARPRHVAGSEGVFALSWIDGPGLQAALYQLGDGDLLDGYQRLGPQRVRSDATSALWAGGRALVATNYADAILEVYHAEGDRFWPAPKSIAAAGDGRRFHGPLLLGDSSTSARALWMQSAGPGGSSMPLTVSASTLFHSGDWSEPEVLAALDASASVASLTGEGSDSGLALVAWESTAAPDAASGSRLGLLVLDADGNADASRPDAIDALGNAYRPAVAVSAAGDAAVTWLSSSGAAGDIDAPAAAWGALAAADERVWSAPVPLSPADVRARPPALALAPHAGGHAAWVEIDAAGGTRLMVSRVSADTGFSAPLDVTVGSPAAAPAYATSVAADVSYGPRVAAGPGGRALAVWVSAAGGVWYSSYE